VGRREGIASVAKRGGITIAQDEATADHFDMPAAALDLGRADLAMSPQRMAEALQVLAEGSLSPIGPPGASWEEIRLGRGPSRERRSMTVSADPA
jgi:CheB methylesterase